MKRFMLVVLLLGASPLKAADFNSVCDRSKLIRSYFEGLFNRHCSEITEAELGSLENENLNVYLKTSAEKLQKGDFRGVKAGALYFRVTSLVSPNAVPFTFSAGVFDDAKFSSIMIAEFPAMGTVNRPTFRFEANAFSGLELESMTLFQLNMNVQDQAFAHLKVKKLNLSASQSALGNPGFMNLSGSPFVGLVADEIELSHVSVKTKWILPANLFQGATARKVKFRSILPLSRRVELEVFNAAKIHWADMTDIHFNEETQAMFRKRYPDMQFSF